MTDNPVEPVPMPQRAPDVPIPSRDPLGRLAEARNPDGGWPYAPGRASRIEPTGWALLATSAAAGAAPDLDVLLRWPEREGWLVDVPGAPVNFAFNAVAALTLLQRPDGVDRAASIARKLLEVKGLRLGQTPILRQDNSLQAWPWIEGTFSWVEPTAWCLLLLKQPGAKLRAEAAGRIAVGEQMLIDRVCRDGGWNYGGSNVYGQELWAYVPTTALGLLAMQDRRDEPAVARSLTHLQGDLGNERSAGALALATIALRVYGAPVDDALKLLTAVLPEAAVSGNLNALAMGVYAMSDTGVGAFRI